MDAVAAFTVIGSVLVAAFTYLGQKAMTKRASVADELQHKQQRDANLVAQLDLQYKRNTEMTSRLDKIEADIRTERMRREALSKQVDEERREREHLTGLYVSLDHRFKAALTYIRSLLDLLASHDIDPPTPPDGLDF